MNADVDPEQVAIEVGDLDGFNDVAASQFTFGNDARDPVIIYWNDS